VAYHPGCIKAGPPFRTRRAKAGGLSFPEVISDWDNFICELCTVRAVLDRELLPTSRDTELLLLERMRMLDIVHHWSLGTHRGYQGKIRVLRRFESLYGAPILRTTALQAPPSGPDVPLQWCQEWYSLRMSPWRKGEQEVPLPVSFTTVRQLRSAANQFYTWDLALAHPAGATRDHSGRVMCLPAIPAPDSLSSSLFAKGLSIRLGTETQPSFPLQERHVRWLDTDLRRRLTATTSPLARRTLALAGLLNLTLWLGWLRARESLDLQWNRITVLDTPELISSQDLPPGVGAALLQLGPETKTHRTVSADCVLSLRTAAGFDWHFWWTCVLQTCDVDYPAPADGRCIFVHADGTPWTSLFFRTSFLYPALELQRLEGDAYLRPFDGSPGNSLAAKFYSLHCYRRGARTHVSRVHSPTYRRPTKDEVYEHARWRRPRSSEAIDVMYCDWPLFDQVKLTLLSM